MLCISGHGLSNNIQLADNTLVNIWTDLIYQFDDTNFKEFRGRPKIVLVNACQGFASREHIVPFSNPISSPNHPDFLVFIATSPGFQTFRNGAIGTHFMRSVAYVLMRKAHNMEIKKLFYLVCLSKYLFFCLPTVICCSWNYIFLIGSQDSIFSRWKRYAKTPAAGN